MKQALTDYIVEQVFTKPELDELRIIYNEEVSDYLFMLDRDPFTYDNTEKELASMIKTLLDARGDIDSQECEIQDLAGMVKYYFI